MGCEWILDIYNGFCNIGNERTAIAASLEKPMLMLEIQESLITKHYLILSNI